MARDPRRRSAIGRSLDVYYRDHERVARMDRLNATLVGPGALVFDIGAHVGDRTGSFLRIGASVVALEPQPRVFRALRLIHGRSDRVRILPRAAGAEPGEIELRINSRNPTVSSVARDFLAAAEDAPGWRGQIWDEVAIVPVTTLDALIREYGRPDFVKIDVEGHEPAVLDGLGIAIASLSFEFTTIQRAAVGRCLDRLGRLGRYEYNLTLGEDHVFRFDTWIGPEEMKEAVAGLPDAANSGDIYARLVRAGR